MLCTDYRACFITYELLLIYHTGIVTDKIIKIL